MSSFASILAQIVESGGPLLAVDDNREESAAVEAVRRGMRLRSQANPDDTFWNELRQLASSNRQGLSRLLGVRPEVIARWPQTIQHYLKKVTDADAHENGMKRPQMIGTGFNDPSPRPALKVVGAAGDTNVGAGYHAPI